jgi:DNA polymerase II small subunit/DNA polymerase delta subunit B
MRKTKNSSQRRQKKRKTMKKRGGNPVRQVEAFPSTVEVQATPYQYSLEELPHGTSGKLSNWFKRSLLNDPEAHAKYEQKLSHKQRVERQREVKKQEDQTRMLIQVGLNSQMVQQIRDTVERNSTLDGQLKVRRLLTGSEDARAAIQNEDYYKKMTILNHVFRNAPAIYHEYTMVMNGRVRDGLQT